MQFVEKILDQIIEKKLKIKGGRKIFWLFAEIEYHPYPISFLNDLVFASKCQPLIITILGLNMVSFLGQVS